uniref:Promethin n=1 Tax=Oryzias latipes TaxID=8090 RepID=A0A3P9HJF9_ORYLA
MKHVWTNKHFMYKEKLQILLQHNVLYKVVSLWWIPAEFSLRQVARLMTTRIGQYVSSHPFLALTLMMFSIMAALPVGIFFTFALVTAIISATGFVFVEVILLIVGGLTLLSILVGIALFSLLVSVVVNAFISSIPSQLKNYYTHWAKVVLHRKRPVNSSKFPFDISTVRKY